MKKRRNPSFSKKEAIQADNALKILDLELNYGAQFFESDGDLPPEIMRQWLDNVRLFEDQAQQVDQITVAEFTGYPSFRRQEDIVDENLPVELEKVLAFLADQAISVNRPKFLDDRAYYTFLTGKLMAAEMQGIRIPGMIHGFIFEEIYPDHPAVAIEMVEEFLSDLMDLSRPFSGCHLSENLRNDTDLITREDVLHTVAAFRESYAELRPGAFDPQAARHINHAYYIFFSVSYQGKTAKGDRQEFQGDGLCQVGLEDGRWRVEGIFFPGFKF